MLSVIVATYNNPDIEARCVEALLKSEWVDFRVVVVDDCSSSPRPPIRPSDTYLRLPDRGGPHRAWNVGASLFPEDDFVLVGSDVVVRPETLRLLLLASEANPSAGLLAASDYKESPRSIPASYSRLPPVPCDGIQSCCLITRAAWRSVGEFDPQFFLTFGDSDWNQRAEDLGVPRLRLPGVFVYHGCSVTRKREGVDVDLALDRDDHVRFLRKWAHRPDVTARHAMFPEAVERATKTYFWSVEGER